MVDDSSTISFAVQNDSIFQAPMKILQQIPSPEFVEEHHGFTLKVFVLGMKKDQIEVLIDGRYLWISAKQIHTNDFQKPYLLPECVSLDNIQAICHDGFLTIHLQKGIFEDNPNLIKVKVKGQSKLKTSLSLLRKSLRAIVQSNRKD